MIISGLIYYISKYLLFTIYKYKVKRVFISFSTIIIKDSPEF
jgi:hypothetical protein